MNLKQQFSLLSKSSIQNNLMKDKIELLVCNSGSQKCKEHLLIINKCYIDANDFHLQKDYMNSIESLKNAFFNTSDLKETTCLKCADLFRSAITESLENLNYELQKLTTGLIRNNRYQFCYQQSSALLNDLKKSV